VEENENIHELDFISIFLNTRALNSWIIYSNEDSEILPEMEVEVIFIVRQCFQQFCRYWTNRMFQ